MKNTLSEIELIECWNQCMSFIDNVQLISSDHFNAWIKPIKPLSFDGSRLDVMVPSSYFHEHLELNYSHVLFPAIKKIFGENVSLFYNFPIKAGDASSKMTVKTENRSLKINQAQNLKPATPFGNPDAESNTDELDSQLNPSYNFSNYCVSDCNKLATSIGQAIVADPTCQTFNPYFVYGASGVGKTHLLHAIGIGLKERNPQMRVLYVTARLFEAQFVHSARIGKKDEFLQFYQSIDCLIVDDVQDLVNKEKTLNAFFHIFNYLKLNGRKLIMSSDCMPEDMPGIPERILTRFKWGINAKIEKPDFELRRRVLVQKAQTEGIELGEELVDYIAQNVTGSIRELEGLMVGLMARAAFLGETVSIALVDSILNGQSSTPQIELDFEMIVQQVSAFYNIDPDSLFTKNRKREIADARQMIMYLAKKHTNMRIKAIGTRLARDHSTVVHACKSISERLGIDARLKDEVKAIEKSLNL